MLLVHNSNVFINQTTFILLKQVVQKDLQNNKKCDFSYKFLEKLLISVGPYQFFNLLFNYFFEKGFCSRNFTFILFSFLQMIPEELITDGHLVLLYRIIMLHNTFSMMDLVPEFLNLIENIIKNRSYYLKKNFPELTYVDLNKT